MAVGAPKASDPPDGIPVEDETDMTSIMSADQARVLKQAAAEESDILERVTAKPPPLESEPEAVAIPKAPAVPSAAPAIAPPAEVSPEKNPQPQAHSPAPTTAAAPSKPGAMWEIAAFALLVAAVVYELRG